MHVYVCVPSIYTYIYVCISQRWKQRREIEYITMNGESTTRESLERHCQGDEEASRRPYPESAPSRRPFISYESLSLPPLSWTSTTQAHRSLFLAPRPSRSSLCKIER